MYQEERNVLTVFLTGAECPFTCLFCDLWQYTIDGPTPQGAIPAQLSDVFEAHAPLGPDWALKLYNASNFFDRRAVPERDLNHIAQLCTPFTRVTVECHPKLVGDACTRFRDALEGRLEVGIGLETVHPSLDRIKDGMSLAEFEHAVRWLADRNIGVRVFVLVGLPWIPADEFALWAARSARTAFEAGASRVSLIPLRTESGTLRALRKSDDVDEVQLPHLEQALRMSLEQSGDDGDGGLVEVDLWDLDQVGTPCGACRENYLSAIKSMNRAQSPARPPQCECLLSNGQKP